MLPTFLVLEKQYQRNVMDFGILFKRDFAAMRRLLHEQYLKANEFF